MDNKGIELNAYNCRLSLYKAINNLIRALTTVRVFKLTELSNFSEHWQAVCVLILERRKN